VSNQASSKVEQLVKEGAAAAKAGDRHIARAKLREAVGIDQRNERAWFLLASVTDDIEEKRTSLGNVLVINPDNARAQQMLEQLDRATTEASRPKRPTFATTEVIQNVDPNTKRTLYIIGGTIAVGLLLVIILFRGGGAGPAATPTSVAELPTEPPTVDAAMMTATTVAETAVFQLTLDAQLTLRALPATWTPQPSSTPRGTLTAVPLSSPPPGVTGRMLAVAGKALTLDGKLPVVMLDLKDGRRTTVAEERGDYAIFSPNADRVIYARYVSGTRPQLLLRIIHQGGARPEELSSLWGNRPPIADHQMPAFALDGRSMVFVGQNVTGENERFPNIYWLAVNFPARGSQPTLTPTITETPTPNLDPTADPLTATWTPTPTATLSLTPSYAELRRLTEKDSGINLYPSLAPDGSKVVYTTDRSVVGGDGTDIYLIDLPSGTPVNLTNDGGRINEAWTQFSPDGTQIVFTAVAEGAADHDLFVINADGSGRQTLLEKQGDIVRPQWSPDGRYIGFSSNRSGKWEIYVVEVASGEVFQVTADKDDILITNWGE